MSLSSEVQILTPPIPSLGSRDVGQGESTSAKPASLPPKPKDSRYQTLDAVRGMACLMLLLYHATFYADHSWSSADPATWSLAGLAVNLVGRLWMGVPMFFVVSGYCIAASVDSLRRKPHSLSQYFYRRIRRIYPPFWAAILLGAGFTWAVGWNSVVAEQCLQLPKLASFTPVDWIANITATASWLPELLGGERTYLLLNTWTLCYEEQFYAVTGLLLVLASRRFFSACYSIALGALVIRHLCRWRGIAIDGYFFDGHWLLFAAGILLYHRVNYLQGRAAWWAHGALAAGMVYGLGERLFAASAHDRHVGEYILVAAAFALLLSPLKRWDERLAAHWSLRPFQWTGSFSYSIYLVHFPITVWIGCVMAAAGWHSDLRVLIGTMPLCLVVSLAVAWMFHRFIERHFANVPQR